MPGNTPVLFHHGNEFPIKITGIRGDEANPTNIHLLAHSGQQLRELHAAGGILPIVDVLPQEDDLLEAVVRQQPGLFHNLSEGAVLLPAAGEGNDTIGTKVIAPFHD